MNSPFVQASTTQSTPPLLAVHDLRKQYPGVKALDGVDFAVARGEVHCLVGQNGAGKSTLIKCISGFAAPSSGRIEVLGAELPTGDPAAALARGVATMYQELDLVADLSVAENILLGQELGRRGPFSAILDRKAMEARARALLGELGQEHISPRAAVGTLAPAAQQMVSMARALSRNLELLIMDEPTAVLDPTDVDALFAVVKRLTGRGVGIIYISHRLDEVARIGDRITVMRDGRVSAAGLARDTPAEVLIGHMVASGSKASETAALGRDTSRRGQALVVPDAVVADPVAPDAPEVLRVRGLVRRPFAQGIDFAIHTGEIVGIAGLVGSGRTELLRCIYGLDAAEAGEVLVAETASGQLRPLVPHRPDLAMAAGIGLAPEERKSAGMWPFWSLTRNVTIADVASFATAGLMRARRETEAARTYLRALATHPDDPGRAIAELSGGNQQKVILARWLQRGCRILLLDEPTRGVDAGAKREIFRVIAQLAARGMAVLMVSSELAELIGFCHRILVLRDGRIRAELSGGSCSEIDILHHAVPSQTHVS